MAANAASWRYLVSLWGGFVGSLVGSALGGPLGAILGAVIGHAVTKKAHQQTSQSSLHLAFITAFTVLGAKMAKSDGRITRDEVAAFKQVFGQLFAVSADDVQFAGKVFNEARSSAAGYEPYAQQIADMVPPQVLEELLYGLLIIAHADGHVHERETAYLQGVAQIFGFNQAQFERILNRGRQGGTARSSEPDPYQILGVDKRDSADKIKTTWRKLMRENHPDRLIAKGLPEEMIEQANRKVADINAAYDRICKERGF